jgi:hypothetical protein
MDEDFQALRAAGYSEDQIFELTNAASYGAGLIRMNAALSCLAGGSA